jgi:tRNA-binding EMAP/Myf-like protein
VVSKKELKKSYLYQIDIGNIINVESTFELNVGEKIVVAKNGTYLMPGRMITPFEIEKGVSSDGRICSNQDLIVPPLEEFFAVIVDSNNKNGDDFFKVERRESDA